MVKNITKNQIIVVRIRSEMKLFNIFCVISVLVNVIFLSNISFGAELLQTASAAPVNATTTNVGIENFCNEVNKQFKKFGWSRIICNPKTWTWDENFKTVKGNPLIYQVFEIGVPESTTIFFCGVHGNEIPSVYQCVHLVRDILFDHKDEYMNVRVVIAPIINPDGFLLESPTRQNARGVDINRNFPTKDFDKDAISAWKKEFKSTPAKYPGESAGSEIETKFQIMLIEKFPPDKIVSIHSPYGWLDYDSPSQTRVLTGDEPDGYYFEQFIKESNNVATEMSKKGKNYKLTKFRIFPGSLGNYAANERAIPTYTLELPTSNAKNAEGYWNHFRKSYVTAIQYKLKRVQDILSK